jgi:hypothetical protein
MKPGDPGKAWARIDRFLTWWEEKASPVNWFGNALKGREGLWVVLRCVILLGLLKLVFSSPVASAWCLIGLGVTVYLTLDIVCYNTSVVFVSRRPARPLRSALLAFFSYLQLGVGFAAFYALFVRDFGVAVGARRALHSSVIIMTTLGYTDLQPLPDRWGAATLFVIQLATSLYFLVILLAGVVAWAGDPKPKA